MITNPVLNGMLIGDPAGGMSPQDILQMENADPLNDMVQEFNEDENLINTLPSGLLDDLRSEIWRDTQKEEASYSEYEEKVGFFIDLIGFQLPDRNPGTRRGGSGDDYIKNTGTANLYSSALGETLQSIVNSVVTRFFDEDELVTVETTGPLAAPSQQVPPQMIDAIKYRVSRWCKVYFTHILREYKEDLKSTIMWAASIGTGSRKCFFDPERGLPNSSSITPGMLLSNIGIDSFYSSKEYTHKYYLTEKEIQQRIDDGLWNADILSSNSAYDVESGINDKLMEMGGRSSDMRAGTSDEDQLYPIYERYKYISLEDGERIPCIITYTQEGALGSIYPNFKPDDPLRLPVPYIVHYNFLPSYKGQSLGLASVAGNNARAATVLERRLIDASLASAFPAAFIKPSVKFQSHTFEAAPGKITTLPVGDDDISKAITFAPTAAPNAFMADLKKDLEDSIRRYSLLVSQDMMDLAQRAPQGSVLSMLSRLEELPNSIIQNFYNSIAEELSIFKRMWYEWLPEGNEPFTINVNGETYQIYKNDFCDYVNIRPAASYTKESEAYKFMRSEIITTQAAKMPELHNMYNVMLNFYKEMGIKDEVAHSFLNQPQQPQPADIILNEAKQMPQVHDMRAVLALYYQSKNIPPEVIQSILPAPQPQQQQPQQIDPGVVGMAEVEAQKQIAEMNAQIKMAQMEIDKHSSDVQLQIEMAKLEMKHMEQKNKEIETEMRILKDQQEIELKEKDMILKEREAEIDHLKYIIDRKDDHDAQDTDRMLKHD